MWSQVFPGVSMPLQTCRRKDSSLCGSNLPPSFHASGETLPVLHVLHKTNPKQLSELRGTDFPEGKTFKGMSELGRGSEQAGKSLKDCRDRRAAGRREHQGTYRHSGALVQHRVEEIIHVVIQAYRGPQVISEPCIWGREKAGDKAGKKHSPASSPC